MRRSPLAVARRYSRIALWAIPASVVIAADQSTKSWAEHALVAHRQHLFASFDLVLAYNSGAAFSLGSGAVPVMEALATALVATLFGLLGRMAKRGASSPLVVGFGLVTGGALSNLADRFFRHNHGAVVDFIQLVKWWPVFNVADAAITIGAVTIAMAVFVSPPRAEARVGAGAPGRAKAERSSGARG